MQWSEEHQCLCDYMGIPLSKTEVRTLLLECQTHLRRSELQLAASANAILQKYHPSMAESHKKHAEDMQ